MRVNFLGSFYEIKIYEVKDCRLLNLTRSLFDLTVFLIRSSLNFQGFPGAAAISCKDLPANAGDIRC